MECVKCHTPLPDSSRFCFACGADQTGGGVDGQSSGPIEVLQARLQRLVQGQYEIKRLLGKGGMGAVFLAHDLTLEREVAIKVLPPDFSSDPQVIKRFQQEAKTAAKLDHTNIIPIFRVESEEGLNYFVMKYISGTSLEDLVESKQEISYDYAQRILWEAAIALGHAHTRGVVHRDVKPANIMFDHDGKVMLTDFGISKALQSANITGTGMVLGTPHYMAPEQAKGLPVDGRADQYSLGVVGYRLLTGALPFSGDSVHTILYKHIFEEAPRLSGLRQDAPRYLTEPIQRALSKEPAQRFPTMEDFATAMWPERPVAPSGKTTPKPLRAPPAAVDRASADTPTEHVASDAFAARPQRSSKVGVFALVALVALVAAAAGGYFVLRGKAGDGREQSTQNPPSPASRQTATTAQSTATATQPPATQATTPATQEPRPQATQPGTTKPQPQTRPQRPQGQQPQAPPPPPPEAEQGYLTIDSDPPGEVFIDGVDAGPTPLYRHAVKAGSHLIRIEAPGYKTLSQRIQVDPGNTVSKRFPLIPE